MTFTQADAEAITPEDEKVVLIDEHLADSDAMDYDMDRAEGEWALKDYVAKGIEQLDNENGFFMMCEGGKIDWACHANDAGATVTDTLALADAVQVAIDFAKEHPAETLIVVTGDHETGGLTIGYAGTDYDTYLDTLSNQKISYAQFDEQYVVGYKENQTATSPTGKVYAESACMPPSSTTVSMDTISPSLRITLLDGIPCTTCSLTEVQSVAGNPSYPRQEGLPP